jgi:heterodisulfide reductase subunit A
MGVDMLVLLVGMKANDLNSELVEKSFLKQQPSGFMQPRNSFLGNVESNVGGIFYAGAVTAPKNVGESLNEGTAAARAAIEWLARK